MVYFIFKIFLINFNFIIGNNISDEGIKHLSEALIKNNSIQNLDIESYFIFNYFLILIL
jgi:hypothetical protein